MKPYIKGQYTMITTISLCDNHFLVVIIKYKHHILVQMFGRRYFGKFLIRNFWQIKRWLIPVNLHSLKCTPLIVWLSIHHTHILLTWTAMKLVEPMIHRYHKCKSIRANPLNSEELTFNHCTDVVVGLDCWRRHLKVTGSLDLVHVIHWNYFDIVTPCNFKTLDRFKHSWLATATHNWNELPADVIL